MKGPKGILVLRSFPVKIRTVTPIIVPTTDENKIIKEKKKSSSLLLEIINKPKNKYYPNYDTKNFTILGTNTVNNWNNNLYNTEHVGNYFINTNTGNITIGTDVIGNTTINNYNINIT